MITIYALWCRSNQRFMIPENLLVGKIKVIVPDLRLSVTITQRIIKCSIQMIIYSAYFHNIPSVPILNSLLRVVAAKCDNTPHSKSIHQNLHRFGNTFADSHTLSQRTNNFMRIWFFQFIIIDILTNKIMDIFFLLPL